MFTNHELIRIYYAVKADDAKRRNSEFSDQMLEEIRTNARIMKMIEATGLILQCDK